MAACLFLSHFSDQNSFAAAPPPSKTQEQMEVTIIHMDKYAVYAPNLIFYYDTEMSKQKAAALTSAAERLRNKKAIVVYSATEDSQHNKRLVLVDVFALKDQQIPTEVSPPADKPGVVSSGEERPKVVSNPVKVEEPPFTGDNRREASETESYRPQPPPSDRPKTAEKETVAKLQPEKVPPLEAGPMEKPAPTSTAIISKEEVSAFIRSILDLNQKKDMTSIMSFFADQVNYYDRGIVSKDYIRKDMGYYFRNWDRISSSLDGDVVLIVTDEPHVRIAKFVSSFSVANAKKSVTGRTENIWKLQKINNELKIIDEKQRLLSSESR